MSYFNSMGRCIPAANARLFATHPSQYYVIDKQEMPLPMILARVKASGLVGQDFGLDDFSDRVSTLKKALQDDANYKNILNGVCVPFIYQSLEPEMDLGLHLENTLLPVLRQAFIERFPQSHFKAVIQGNASLEGRLQLAQDSGYEAFIAAARNKPTVGLYFPQALQEYDIRSQRDQLRTLPPLNGAQICLSGGMDVCAALTVQPELLISESKYPPILCLSAYVHQDPRLILMVKAYGPHLEFWCMTQMLTPSITQVSEQWSGGITVF